MAGSDRKKTTVAIVNKITPIPIANASVNPINARSSVFQIQGSDREWKWSLSKLGKSQNNQSYKSILTNVWRNTV
ncbi:MAG: hypothetical protein HC763_22450 [Hydrococcus sp. CRU_1_1]|nr:hypothetical protein [Hydrococcus sp. CRU_1_1]